jgi:hypothetical protein
MLTHAPSETMVLRPAGGSALEAADEGARRASSGG